jgi:hypothetical protein
MSYDDDGTLRAAIDLRASSAAPADKAGYRTLETAMREQGFG